MSGTAGDGNRNGGPGFGRADPGRPGGEARDGQQDFGRRIGGRGIGFAAAADSAYVPVRHSFG